MRVTPVVLLLTGLLSSSVSPVRAGAEPLCDPDLKQRSTDPHGYRVRGDRCEGVYLADVASTSLHVASFTKSFDDHGPASVSNLLIQWTAPAPGTVALQAMDLRPRRYYRMDTARPADAGSYRWPTNLLGELGITRKDLGVVAWTKLPVGATEEKVYLPLAISQGEGVAPSRAYRVVVWPGRELTEVFVSLAPVGSDGRVGPFARDEQPLKYGYYPADRGIAIDIPIAELKARGVYYLLIAATVRGGGPSSIPIWFYHPGR